MTTETTGTTKKNYKDTLNLPQTAFAMEAKLVQNEPARLKKWQDLKLYDQLMKARQGAERWVLHDGPPFANGDIHIGHLINKTLKDVIMRFRSMQGKQTPYVPGWDCHGLPIEHKIQEDFQKKLGAAKFRELSALEVRKACYEYAEKYARIQSEQFQRLGILGEWERPYLTMTPDYEASTLEVFARFVEAGLVYKKLKPVPWSVSNQTALADAELEYKDVEDPSVYVEFPVADPQMLRRMFQEREKDSAPWHTNDGSSIPSYWEWESDLEVFFIAWTTTPWTLPANLAIAAHPDINYAAVKYQRNGKTRIGIVAVDLISAVFAKTHGTVENFLYVASVPGRALVEAQAVYKHPFVGREGRIVAADYVTTTDGTGLVHTAPGHGEDDYETGIREGLPVYSPVLANGRFDETVPEWLHGLTVWEGNPIIT